MLVRLRECLMRAAFRADKGPLWRRLVRRLARRLLRVDRNESWGTGPGLAVMATRPVRLRAGDPRPAIASRAQVPMGRGHAAGAFRMTGSLPLFEPRIELPEIPGEMPFDPQVADWMREVTEPYILWDAPKPEYGELPPVRFGDLSAPANRGLPERPAPRVESGLPELREVEESLADLHRRHALFRLPAEEILRKRYSRVLHK